MVKKVDLNTDSGESFGNYKIGNDEEVFKYVTSANIACGFHAGDPNVMRKTVRLAKNLGVAVGAHPGFPDLLGFGRRNMEITKNELENYIIYQLGALEAFTRAEGIDLQHVKAHGALYNMAVTRHDYAEALANAVKTFNPKLIIIALPNSEMRKISEEIGLKVAYEFFADRNYKEDGSLVPRSHPQALVINIEEAIKRAIRAVDEGLVRTIDGKDLEVTVHTICIHGDSPHASEIAKALRTKLEEVGIKVAPLRDIL
jgi:UPF0271 protein